jgi:hypothetical protein
MFVLPTVYNRGIEPARWTGINQRYPLPRTQASPHHTALYKYTNVHVYSFHIYIYIYMKMFNGIYSRYVHICIYMCIYTYVRGGYIYIYIYIYIYKAKQRVQSTMSVSVFSRYDGLRYVRKSVVCCTCKLNSPRWFTMVLRRGWRRGKVRRGWRDVSRLCNTISHPTRYSANWPY